MSESSTSRAAEADPPDDHRLHDADLRRDLLSTRDALLGAQAEAATLKVLNRDLEVRCAQLEAALHAQTRLARLVGRLTGNRYVSTVAMKVRSVKGPAATD